jgi:hypothetical protein
MSRVTPGYVYDAFPNIIHRPILMVHIFFFANRATAPAGPGPPHYPGLRITLSETHRTRWHSSGRVISPNAETLPDNTHKRQTSIPPKDSNPQFQQVSGLRPTPYTARPLGSAYCIIYPAKCDSRDNSVLHSTKEIASTEIARLFSLGPYIKAEPSLGYGLDESEVLWFHPRQEQENLFSEMFRLTLDQPIGI